MTSTLDLHGERLCLRCRSTARPFQLVGGAVLYRCVSPAQHHEMGPQQQRRGLVDGQQVVGAAGEIDGR